MANELITINNEMPVFKNRQLNTATQKIFKKGELIGKAWNEVARVLADVQAKEMYKDDGFKSAAEYAMKTFNIKKSFAYSLIKIGDYFITPTLESNLKHDKEDFSVTQLEAMLPLLKSEEVSVDELVESGEITPDMTKEEIKKVVKQYMPKKNSGQPEKEVEADVNETETIDSGTEIKDYEMAGVTATDAITRLLSYVEGNESMTEKLKDMVNDIDKIVSAIAMRMAVQESNKESEEN